MVIQEVSVDSASPTTMAAKIQCLNSRCAKSRTTSTSPVTMAKG
jgi:hypothetical protein